MAELGSADHFLVLMLLMTSCFRGFYTADRRLATCGNIIDLLQTDTNQLSGVLDVPMPESMARYQDPNLNLNCDIRIIFSGGLQLMIELYYLDIMPVSQDQTVCSTGLEVFESHNGGNVYGGRLCMEGWEWEERHRERKREKKIIENSPVTFRLVSEGPYRGYGFKVHYNVFRANSVCMRKEFRCREFQRCVSDDITCDGWDDCEDNSDESEDAGCGLLAAAEIVAVIVGIILFLETVTICVLFCIKYRRLARNYQIKSQLSLASSSQNLKPAPEPNLVFPHRFNSMESMNKSNYSKRSGTRRDSDSSIDKNELEKSDRHSIRDNASERSYRSRQSESRKNGPLYQKRRSRGSSPTSVSRDRLETVDGSVNGSQPDLGTNSDKDASDKDKVYKDSGRDRDRRSRDRRRDDRYSDSDDRSPPRRRRSRRRYDYSSEDDDYDSDYEYERRRRRRRSQDRYSRDRYDDDTENSDYSDYERRRRRSRDRYNRDKRDYSDDEPDRRRRSSRDRARDRYDREPDSYDDDDYRPRRRRPSQERDRRRDDPEADSYDDEDYRPRRRRKPSQERDRRRDDNEDDNNRNDRRRGASRERDRRQNEVDRDDSSQPSYRQSSNPDRERGRGGEIFANDRRQSPSRDQDNWNKPSDRRSRSRENINSPYNHQRSSPPPPSTPPKGEDLRKFQRPSNTPAQPPVNNNKNHWMPRSERRKKRRSQDELALHANRNQNDSPPPIYEDVMPRVELENFGYREEAV